MKNNQTLFAAGAFIILALIYYFTQSGSVDTKSIDSELFRVKPESVASIQLNNTSGTLVLEKGPDRWILEKYPVDTMKMSSLLDQFTELTVDRLITSNSEKYSKYEVVDQGNSILLLDSEGAPLLELLLGKQGANYAETFVRNPAEDQVFAVKSNLAQYKNMSAKDFWDRTFASLSLGQIKSVDFKGEINYSLQRQEPTWTFNGELVDPDKVANLLRPFDNMKGTGFANELSEDTILYQSISVGLIDGTSLEYNFFKKDEKGVNLLVTASNKSKIFEFSTGGLNKFKKSITDLSVDPSQN